MENLLLEKSEYGNREIVLKARLHSQYRDNTLYDVDSINFKYQTIVISRNCNHRLIRLASVDLYQLNGPKIDQIEINEEGDKNVKKTD